MPTPPDEIRPRLMMPDSAAPPAFTALIDLASARTGSRVLAASDDFFAEKENLIRDETPVFKAGVFTDRGKWMDGWESRRRRTPGNDWAVVALGYRGVVHGVNIDTRHFSGNQPEEATLDVFDADGGQDPPPGDGPFEPAGAASDRPGAASGWRRVLGPVPLGPDAPHYFAVEDAPACTHLRLSIYPDGGVARLRAYGVVVPDFTRLGGEPAELSSHQLGGQAVACSDEHFGRMQHLLQPGPPVNMGDGWETRRRRGEGFDWAIIALGCPGYIDTLQVETTHFKGNYPAACRVEACRVVAGADPGNSGGAPDPRRAYAPPGPDVVWEDLTGEAPLGPDAVHRFSSSRPGPFTHVRICIYPDGGVARLRVFGRPAP